MNSLSSPESSLASVPVSAPSIDLGSVDKVLIKFQFTNGERVPEGIYRFTTSEQLMDKRHAQRAQQGGYGQLAQVGRVRAGRVDTGICLTPHGTGINYVQAGLVRRGLTNVQFPLRQCHSKWYPDKKYHGSNNKEFLGNGKDVVTLGFQQGEFYDPAIGDKDPNWKNQHEQLNRSSTTEAIRALARITWGICHIWFNPNERSATINLSHIELDAPAMYAVRVCDKKIIWPTCGSIDESQE